MQIIVNLLSQIRPLDAIVCYNSDWTSAVLQVLYSVEFGHSTMIMNSHTFAT